MTKAIKTTFVAVLLVSTILPSEACRGPHLETSTLLRVLPEAAMSQDIVAKVQIIELVKPTWPWTKEGWKETPLAKVIIRDGIKGAKQGDVITINSIGTSCDQRFTENSVGRTGFIAGRIEGADQLFVGAWKYNGEGPVKRNALPN